MLEMSCNMSNESIPACEHLLAGVTVPNRKDALVVSVFSIDNEGDMIYEDVVAVVCSSFADTVSWSGDSKRLSLEW